MSGERSPGPGTGGREAGPQAVSAREPGAERSQPGPNAHTLACPAITFLSTCQNLTLFRLTGIK